MNVGVEHKDVVLALMGASAALSGLVLVFLGLIIGAYGGLAGDVPAAVRAPLRRTGLVILAPFLLGILAIGAGAWWLLRDGTGAYLYGLAATFFVLQLVSLVVAAFWTVRKLLWG